MTEMKLMIDTGCDKMNKEVFNFQKNMKKFFPDVNDTILHLAVVDYLQEIKDGKLDCTPLIEKYVQENTDDKDFDLLKTMYDKEIQLDVE